jgi:hypothetical protein
MYRGVPGGGVGVAATTAGGRDRFGASVLSLLSRVFPEPAIVPTVLTPTAAKQSRASKRRRDFNLIFIDDVLPGFDHKLEFSHCSNSNEFELAAAFGRICADEFSVSDCWCQSQPYAFVSLDLITQIEISFHANFQFRTMIFFHGIFLPTL